MGIGDWGVGVGAWGLGVWGWAQTPNPQSPIPNPQKNEFLNILYVQLIITNKKILKFS